jgi:arsenical pump membrane protein
MIDHPTLVAHLVIWIIAGLATAGVIIRPFKWPEAIWAAGGAVVLVAAGLLTLAQVGAAVAKGLDVYLFLIGMMLLSETARLQGLFDRVAALAVNHARGSPRRLFLLVYTVGVGVTAFLSNDATAVVLTPAVYAAARKARVEPLPYLFVCAFIANAASFLLPISNPANLVLYGGHTPPLGPWLARFLVPSLLAIGATYGVLRGVEGRRLAADCAQDVAVEPMSAGAWTALIGIALTALALLAVSAFDIPLGAPTCVMGVATTALVLLRDRASPGPTLRGVSWSVLPLVAGLFVLVEALGATGLTAHLASLLAHAAATAPEATGWASGGLIAAACNLMNNLPAGLIASSALSQAHAPTKVVDALLIGVDLGPNLSVTGSLATIRWLSAIRREGQSVGFWRFLRLGLLVTPPALVLALGARLVVGG